MAPAASSSSSSKGKSNGDKGKKAASPSEGDGGEKITLISEEGDSFSISKSAACHSGTIRDMLEGGFAEAESGKVTLQIRSAVLEIVVSYLEWFEKYSDAPEGTRIPDFEKGIPADLALELHMTADFLDV